jgi:NAD+ synthase (glutamine-hydrolysing)
MTKKLALLMAQINTTVGAIQHNAEKIIHIIETHQHSQDVILFPELVLSGYLPEDLLFRHNFHAQIEEALKLIAEITQDCFVILGHPSLINNKCYNSASVFHQGKRIALYHKQNLPNYGVFDESRYFVPGPAEPCVITIQGYKLGICICEDLWQEGPTELLIDLGIDGLACINASPFDYKKYLLRENLVKSYAKKGLDIFYVNLIGGQDELIFDGLSMAVNNRGKLCARLPAFEEILQPLLFSKGNIEGQIVDVPEENALIYNALVLGTRDYVEKNGFPGVLLGLSGGIDSALTLAIAVDALGSSRVEAVMMPSRYTAPISGEDAVQELQDLNVKETTISIEPIFESLLEILKPRFANAPQDITEENLQARIRATLLMAISNKTGNMVLTTSNKSETAVGYTTLYGDMAGGFAVLKDVLKTQVYALAKYRNQISPIIPERVLQRAPSAELAFNQTDQDSLPDYPTLDAIIELYMMQNLSSKEINQKGFSAKAVHKVIGLIKKNEYKRRQAPPGIKISRKAFGKDWRYPITSGFES